MKRRNMVVVNSQEAAKMVNGGFSPVTNIFRKAQSGWAKKSHIGLNPSENGYCFSREPYLNFALPGYENDCRAWLCISIADF